jgi:hypothetical protein
MVRPQCVEAVDGLFVLFDAASGPVGDDEVALPDLEGLSEDRGGPVPPFEPVAGLGYSHQMCRELRIEGSRRAPQSPRQWPPWKSNGLAGVPLQRSTSPRIGGPM